MAGPGTAIFIIVVVIIVIVIKGAANRGKVDAGLYKNQTYVNLKTGYTCDIALDYNGTELDVIRKDEETGRLYVIRKAGSMDRGDKRVWVGVYKKFEFHGWTLILDGMEGLADSLVKEKLILQNKYEVERSEHDHTKAELLEYKAKFGQIQEKSIKDITDIVDKIKPIMKTNKR